METTRHKVATRTRPGTGSPRVPWIGGACRKCATTTSAARTQFIEQKPAPAQSLSIAHTAYAHRHAHRSVPDHVMHGPARRARNFDATIVSFATIARVVPDHAARPRSAQLRRRFRLRHVDAVCRARSFHLQRSRYSEFCAESHRAGRLVCVDIAPKRRQQLASASPV